MFYNNKNVDEHTLAARDEHQHLHVQEHQHPLPLKVYCLKFYGPWIVLKNTLLFKKDQER